MVSGEIGAVLQAQSQTGRGRSDGPGWLDAPAAARRSTVWQAMGFVNSALAVPSPDALALLRARAYAEGTSLDELAARVLDRTVPLDDLAPDADSSR
ncbi:ANTAR domain-containing protein [Modestobacter roseus]|uniref:ANTAR domain-containing protein n=1 Tax=Modestobacter roseus TaxID=1181884 RepID=A0A562ILQ6_9ACTN|nr:ANTAR domain-containing protein [Modestobacter roseus]TWH71655.1 hypothetical protein JD78_00153 [Modestobacter roseus]